MTARATCMSVAVGDEDEPVEEQLGYGCPPSPKRFAKGQPGSLCGRPKSRHRARSRASLWNAQWKFAL